MKTIAKVLLAISALALVAGCGARTPHPRGYIFEQSSSGEDACQVETYMEGAQNVLYFNCNSRDFAKALADYQADHPNTRIVSHSGNGALSYPDRAYIVVTEPYTPPETAE